MNRNTDFIPFALPSIGKEEEKAVLSVLRSKWLTTGRVTEQFEKDFSSKISSKYALAVNSATAGLHLALEALSLEKSSYVITTPYTFAATAEIILYLGLHPYFIDIADDDYNIDPEKIRVKLKKNHKKISCILPVHIAGRLCRIDEIMHLASEYNKPVVEDAAHAFPLVYNNKSAGTFGDAGVFSFYTTKTITTGEGGMVVTDNESIAKRIRLMRLHGIDRDVWDRYKSKNAKWYYEVKEPGFKYNLSDIASAIGIEQLKKADLFHEKRKKIAQLYNRYFSEYDFLKLPSYSDNHSWHLYIVQIRENTLNISRNEFIDMLSEKGVGTSVHFIPLHIMPYYKNRYSLKPDDFPESFKKYQCSISLPIYPDLNEEQVFRVINAVVEIGRNNIAAGRLKIGT